MARLTATPSFTGTVGPVTVYRMYGQYYVRSRSSLTGKRMKKDPAFRKTMQYAALLSRASQIASKVYAAVQPLHKKHTLYRKLTGEAMTWLKYDWSATDIIEYLILQYGGVKLPAKAPVTKLRPCYRRSGAGESRTIRGLARTSPAESIPFELRAWRRRDKRFRSRLFTDPMVFSQHTYP